MNLGLVRVARDTVQDRVYVALRDQLMITNQRSG